MAGQDYKVFLNNEILGGNAGIDESRRFKREAKIQAPEYNAKYFETFPTVWACAYAFQKLLFFYGESAERHRNQQPAQETSAVKSNRRAAEVAVKEWAVLFFLRFFGIAHLASFPAETLKNRYDKDLWPALSGTYPDDTIDSIKMLRTSDGAVVGAYYPEIIFFPSRGRAAWGNSPDLRPLLHGTTLSWEECSKRLARDEEAGKAFHAHLLSIAKFVRGPYRTALESFCRREQAVGTLPAAGALTALNADLTTWPRWVREGPKALLDAYPLVREIKEGDEVLKRFYYLVEGMPAGSGEWMNQPIRQGMPSPAQYRRKDRSDTEIVVYFGSEPITCPLDTPREEIVMLKDCFLSDAPYACGIPKPTDEDDARYSSSGKNSDTDDAKGGVFQSRIESFHKVKNDDRIFSELDTDDVPVCLAPVNLNFLRHFREDGLLQKIDANINREREGVDWLFALKGRTGSVEVKWATRPSVSPKLLNSPVAIWPPQVSEDWHLYVARGTGDKNKGHGRWTLVDEKGEKGDRVDLSDEEYLSILHKSDASNRPRSLLLYMNETQERGVLFLAALRPQTAHRIKTASLAVDFGTSNTCLAYKIDKGEPQPLIYTLKPLTLWGEHPKLDIGGFVPFKWGGREGIYPTILMTRKKAADIEKVKPDAIRIEHLFQSDIPGLHSGLEGQLSTGGFDERWNIHDDLKWDMDRKKEPLRAIFLGLSVLYAHAEIFFGSREGIKINNYVFTFPLAFKRTEMNSFKDNANEMIGKVRSFCYGEGKDKIESIEFVNESTAIAEFEEIEATKGGLDVFIDVGGGTADIAVRHDTGFLVLDSIKVAGKTFFSFAKKNFAKSAETAPPGASQFKKHLGKMLIGEDNQEFSLEGLSLDLGTVYSIAINRLTDKEFKENESTILEKKMGRPSFQLYRTQLLFRHILAYALLQACAAAVNRKLILKSGIKLILAGNAWGLLLFAEFDRSERQLKKEAQEILTLITNQLLEQVAARLAAAQTDEEKAALELERQCIEKLSVFKVKLLNEAVLSRAKTAVARGALYAITHKQKAAAAAPRDNGDEQGEQDNDKERISAFTGITIRNLRLSNSAPTTIRWCDLWSDQELLKTFKKKRLSALDFEEPDDMRIPMDSLLSVFTRLGNSDSYDEDILPETEWEAINSSLSQGHKYLDENESTQYSPISYFISRVLYPDNRDHDILKKLAVIDGSLKNS